MAINKFNIKKWYRMLTGKSILHVKQEAGRFYDKRVVKGYYNDFREKILRAGLKLNELPKTDLPNGTRIDFSIAIFQYGLGAYDLFLETNDRKYYNIFLKAVDWAFNNQQENGGWITFEHECQENPYSSMAQGEGISLLIRGYNETKEKKYLNRATEAFKYMRRNIKEKGCTYYSEEDIFLKEFPEKPTVLNGWIFSLFGVYDYYLITKDSEVKDFFEKSIKTLEKVLPQYDTGYWSKYDINKKIASPFYHKLHVELLKVLYDITQEKVFNDYSIKFEKYNGKKINKIRAFVKKSWQKITER